MVGPGRRALDGPETGQPPATAPPEQLKVAMETAEGSLLASEDSFVFVSDVDIVGEHLDEVFYGEAPADVLQQREHEAECGAGMRSRRESQRSAKESGSVLFETEETTLTPIFISPGPPKIIDPILLEEPAAMSFMYSDLYEDAMGERRKSDEEHSESESVASEKTSKRRLSDSEEADGYLEKFILKDETPTVEPPPESAEDSREGRMMWAQSKFELTGCLTRAAKGEDEVKREREESEEQETTAEGRDDDAKRATFDEHVGGTVEKESSTEKSIQESRVRDEEVERHLPTDQRESCESSSGQAGLRVRPISSKDEGTELAEPSLTDQSQSLGGANITEQRPAKVPEASAGIRAEIGTAGGWDTFPGAEKEDSAEASQREEDEAAASAGVGVLAACDASALVELDDQEELPSQEAGSTEKTAAGEARDAESLAPEFPVEARGEDESAATRAVAAEEAGSSPETLLQSGPETLAPTAAPTGKRLLVPEAKEQDSTEDRGNRVPQKTADEDFVLLVPKGQAVEMDIEISRFPSTTADDNQRGDLTPPLVTMETESPDSPGDEMMAEPQLEVKANDDQEQKSHVGGPAPAQGAISDEDEALMAQEQLSGPEEDVRSEATHGAEEVELSKAGGDEERWSPEADVCGEDEEAQLKPEEAESADVNAEELDYEVIGEQEAQELMEEEPQRDAEEPEAEAEPQRGLLDLSPEEEHMEDDYEFFDAEEERQARLAAQLQGLDWFCFTCGDLLSEEHRAHEEHRDHDGIDVDTAYEHIKVKRVMMGWC